MLPLLRHGNRIGLAAAALVALLVAALALLLQSRLPGHDGIGAVPHAWQGVLQDAELAVGLADAVAIQLSDPDTRASAGLLALARDRATALAAVAGRLGAMAPPGDGGATTIAAYGEALAALAAATSTAYAAEQQLADRRGEAEALAGFPAARAAFGPLLDRPSGGVETVAADEQALRSAVLALQDLERPADDRLAAMRLAQSIAAALGAQRDGLQAVAASRDRLAAAREQAAASLNHWRAAPVDAGSTVMPGIGLAAPTVIAAIALLCSLALAAAAILVRPRQRDGAVAIALSPPPSGSSSRPGRSLDTGLAPMEAPLDGLPPPPAGRGWFAAFTAARHGDGVPASPELPAPPAGQTGQRSEGAGREDRERADGASVGAAVTEMQIAPQAPGPDTPPPQAQTSATPTVAAIRRRNQSGTRSAAEVARFVRLRPPAPRA